MNNPWLFSQLSVLLKPETVSVRVWSFVSEIDRDKQHVLRLEEDGTFTYLITQNIDNQQLQNCPVQQQGRYSMFVM